MNKDNFFKMSSNKRKAASKSKSKAKKEARRMEKMKEAERKSNIQRANWINGDENSPRNVLDTNSLKADSPFRNYIKNDLSVHISFASPSDLSDADFACLYDITRTNMLEHYNRAAEVDPTDVRYFKKISLFLFLMYSNSQKSCFYSSMFLTCLLCFLCFVLILSPRSIPLHVVQQWSWNEKKKMEEFKHSDARYIIARASPSSLVAETKAESNGDIVGFAHIRFELEGVYEVTYIYELQISNRGQRQGLGKRMMQLIELVSVKMKMKWVMLTVFKGNSAAGDFYKKLKYALDEIDPSLCEESATDEPKPYNILSKCVDREEKKRLAAIQFLNFAVAEDERKEQAARTEMMMATPTKGRSTQKKVSP